MQDVNRFPHLEDYFRYIHFERPEEFESYEVTEEDRDYLNFLFQRMVNELFVHPAYNEPNNRVAFDAAYGYIRLFFDGFVASIHNDMQYVLTMFQEFYYDWMRLNEDGLEEEQFLEAFFDKFGDVIDQRIVDELEYLYERVVPELKKKFEIVYAKMMA